MRGRRVGLAVAALVALVAATLAAVAQVPGFPAYESKGGVYATATAPETCVSCHVTAPQEAAPPVAPDEERREVVIVGAGLAGLTAGYRLRDRDLVILEKDAGPGGKMKASEWRGIKYSQGPAYLIEPEGEVKDLLAELALEPRVISEPANAVVIDGKVVRNPWTTGLDDLPFPDETRERLRKGFRALEALANDIAVPARASPKKLLELDRVPAIEYFSQYGPELVRLVRPYIRSCFAIEPDEVSALGALTFMAAEFTPTYSFPGGLAAIPERIVERLGAGKVRYGSFVTEIAPIADGVRVSYRDPEGGTRVIRARAAIVSISQTTAKYLVRGLTDERRDAMSRVYHGGYAVAALRTKSRFLDGCYDTWFLDGPVTDVIVADWVSRDSARGTTGAAAPTAPSATASTGGGVLSAYMPLGVAGRAELLSMTAEDVKERFLGALAPRVPGLREALVDVEVFFHGHAMHVAFPGYVTEVTPKLAEPLEDKIFFAGVELDLPCLESAVWSGAEAAKAARAALEKRAAPR